MDALAILRLEPNLLVGNHGAEWPTGDISRGWEHVQCSMKWKEQLHDKLYGSQGIEIEFKGESISIHYRKAEHQQNAIDLIAIEINKLEPVPRIIGGKYVVNLLPMDALTKGEALKAAMLV